MAKIMLDSNSRITVVGTSGAGKSSLARRLSLVLGLKDIELDALFWGPEWTPTDHTIFKKRIEEAMSTAEGWIVHGNYSKTRDITWGRASVIIWLDYSRWVVFWRVFKRSVLRIVKSEELWSGNKETFQKTFLSKDSILLWSLQTYNLRRKQYAELLRSQEYSHLHILRFKNPRDLENFLLDTSESLKK